MCWIKWLDITRARVQAGDGLLQCLLTSLIACASINSSFTPLLQNKVDKEQVSTGAHKRALQVKRWHGFISFTPSFNWNTQYFKPCWGSKKQKKKRMSIYTMWQQISIKLPKLWKNLLQQTHIWKIDNHDKQKLQKLKLKKCSVVLQ